LYWPHDLSRRLGLVLIFLWFAIGGAGHFIWTSAFVAVMPPYAPFPLFWVLFTGVCELAGALALFAPPRLRAFDGIALALLTICVTPANVEMLIHADRYPTVGAPLLALRIVFQPVLVWIIWRSTRAPAAARVAVV
jgi:uncharacterized membrane protein